MATSDTSPLSKSGSRRRSGLGDISSRVRRSLQKQGANKSGSPGSDGDLTPTPLMKEEELINTDSPQASTLILAAVDRGPGRGSPTLIASPPTPIDGLSLATSPRSGTERALAAFGLGMRSTPSSATTPVHSPDQPSGSTGLSPPSRRTSLQPSQPVGGSQQRDRGRRSSSPFFRARKSREQARERARSPDVTALPKDVAYAESAVDDTAPDERFQPQASAFQDETDAEDQDATTADVDSDEDRSDLETDGDVDLANDQALIFDEETEKNTLANAHFVETAHGDGTLVGTGTGRAAEDGSSQFDLFGEEVEQDVLGEGPNVVLPPEPVFASKSFREKRTTQKGLDLITGRPSFGRDRCTIVLTQGDPDGALEDSGKRLRRYVVLSDLSQESGYAVEWAIGTVARDGDEVFVISVKEDESKVDPKNRNTQDRAVKLRLQKEVSPFSTQPLTLQRQQTALLLTRQVTGLLQRTNLNITVTCQFLHAKNARHMLLGTAPLKWRICSDTQT